MAAVGIGIFIAGTIGIGLAVVGAGLVVISVWALKDNIKQEREYLSTIKDSINRIVGIMDQLNERERSNTAVNIAAP